MSPIRWGDMTIEVLSDGTWRLDGGMMFGIVPKVLWERVAPADEKNRILMALNCLLVRTGRQTLLVDTGLGDVWDEKFHQIYAPDRSRPLMQRLAERGVRPEDVDIVINTHLHFDHSGNNTREQDGRLRPTFPRARYIVQRGEYEHANAPTERDRASYRSVTWEPLERTHQLELIEGDQEIVPGVRVLKVGGHNRDLQIVLLHSHDRTLVFWSDLIPMTPHVQKPWIAALDQYPLETLAQKTRLLRQAVEEEWLCVFYHDPRIPIGRVVESDGRFHVIPIEGG